MTTLKRHFEKELTKAKKKLCQNGKVRKELEQEIETFEDGIKWCESIYKVSTNK